jgi:acetyl esterase/lipase
MGILTHAHREAMTEVCHTDSNVATQTIGPARRFLRCPAVDATLWDIPFRPGDFVQRVQTPRLLAAGVAAGAILILLVYVVIIGSGGAPENPSPEPSGAFATPPPSVSEAPSASDIAIPPASIGEQTPGPPPITETVEPCGTFDPRCSRMPVDVAGAPFTPEVPCGERGACVLAMDIFHPRPAGPWPVVVAIPGGPAPPGTRSYLADFAQLVAGQGAVVFVADYRESPQWGGGSPVTYQDIACAIRFARVHAAEYGGDGSRVSLVGHSLGPFFATTVALSGDSFEPVPGGCLVEGGSTKPDALIGIAGIYTQAGLSPGFLDSFFGGAQDQVPAAWAAGDPYAVIAESDSNRLPVRLIHGEFDANVNTQSSQDFERALEAAGIDSQLSLIPGADHGSILQNRGTIRIVLETALGLG